MYNNNNNNSIPPSRAGQNVASPPGRAGQNNNNPPGRAGQAAASQLQQLEKLTVSGFNRLGTSRYSIGVVLIDIQPVTY
jgi:hypothetical protein